MNEALIKKYGDLIKSGKSVVDRKKKVISVSPAIDIGLGGGIPEGSLFILTGKPKAGKTTTSLMFAKNAQLDGREIYYLNIEGRLRARDLAGILGLDLEKFHVIESSQGNILSAQKYLEIAEVIINTVPNAVVIIDSFSALCTQEEMTADIDKMLRADGPKLLAKFCRKIANVLPVNNTILVGITHISSNVTGYGSPFTEKSGWALAYQVDVKLWAKGMKDWRLSDDSGQIGQIVEWDVITSAISGPGQKVQSYIRYGEGIDNFTELANMAADMGIIKKGGAWYTLNKDDGSEEKVQGLEKVRLYLKDNPKVYD